jgi:spore coat protein U-like protein
MVAAVVIMIMVMAGTAMAADTAQVNVSATVTGVCKFVAGGTISYTLDPSVGTNVNGTVSQPTFWCTKGSSYAITDDNGVNKTGTTYRVKDSGTDYIPYSFTYTSTGSGQGKSTTLSMNIASAIQGTDYINAPAGSYSDTVTLSINP